MKVIMVVGQTGSGKSTLLDALTNFLGGFQFDFPFRYKLVDEKAILKKKNNDQSNSVTDDVTNYYIRSNNASFGYCVLLIDTPGFMDTRGVDRDK